MMKLLLPFIFLIPFLSISQTQIGNDIDGKVAGDKSGWSVSLSSDGSVVAIGAINNEESTPSNVRVYKKNISNDWEQIGDDINEEGTNDYSGRSVSLSSDGSIVAIGAPYNDSEDGSTTYDSGHVRIYENIDGDWVQIGDDINGEEDGDESGYSVSLSSDGTTVAIGAINNVGKYDTYGSGHVRVYKNINRVWKQVGDDIDGEGTTDKSGWSISLSSDGTTVAIGSPFNGGKDDIYGSGHVRVYKDIDGDWQQIGDDIDSEAAEDYFGWSVSLSSDGAIVAIGAIRNDITIDNDTANDEFGHVRVYENIDGDWVQIGDDIDGEEDGDESGYNVSISSNGSIVAISSVQNNNDSGRVRVYKNINRVWKQIGDDINGEANNDLSGFSVSLSSDGSKVAIGAPYNDGNYYASGHVRVYDLSTILLASDTFVLSQFRLSPNPANNQITIKLHNGLALEKVSIYNSLGQFIQTTQKEVIDIPDLSTGLYYVEVVTNKGKATKKLVVE